MELGPLQKKWIEALRSGKYQQGKGMLNRGDQYCCLGVACEVLGLPKGPIDYINKMLYIDDEAPNEVHTVFMPGNSWKKLGLFNYNGAPSNSYDDSLVGLNDKGLTFEQIADILEKKPEVYFSEPK